MKYLLAISIGPVQDFIATARRSRDLWFGSWLLSEISKAAANEIVIIHNDKSRLIFPSTDDPGDLIPDSQFNVVNKILAIIDDPSLTGKAVLEAMRKRLIEISSKATTRIAAKDSSGYFLAEVARKQIEDMLEFFWSAYPIEDESEYSFAREKVEALLSARKSTRSFRPSTEWARNVPKSALDGLRESVIHEDAFSKFTDNQLREVYGVRAGERLCGVGLLKRNGNRGTEDSFFSTSHVAALPLIERLKGEQRARLGTYVSELCDALNLDRESSELGRVPYKKPYEPHQVFSRSVRGQQIGYDGHILFSERLDDLIGNKSEKEKVKSALEKARHALRGFLKDAVSGEAPSPYYSLLLADGDNMGKVIDNIAQIPIESLGDIEKHRRLSQSLSAFAKSVSQIVVRKHKGSLVYAGGDDVLAFLPLHTVLQCARDLAGAFKKQLEQFKFNDEESDSQYQPTLSVGIVIAHHLEPLQDALALVRKAERAAKALAGKEALAVILSKRGGADTIVRGSWKSDKGQSSIDARLLRFAQLHLAGDIPDGAAFELRDLHFRLNCDKREIQFDILQQAMRDEAVRIMGRKAIEDEKIKDSLLENLKSGSSIEDLANELIVARQFAKAFEQAGKTPKDLDDLCNASMEGEV